MRIPASHTDLLDRPLPAALTTHFAGGRLQSSVIWFWRTGDDVCFTTMTEFVKARNLRQRPRATLVVWDLDGRWLELRCAAAEVPQTRAEALAACDDAALRYCGVRPYFGAVVPARWAEREHPVTFRFTPVAVTAGRWAQGDADVPPPPAPRDAAEATPAGHGAEPAPVAGRAAGPAPGAGPGARPVAVAGAAVAPATPAVPLSHVGLFAGSSVSFLATRDESGHARVQPVACALVGLRPAARPTREQADDLGRDPRPTLLVVDRADSGRWIEVRADAGPADGGWWVLAPQHVVVDAIHP